LATTSAWEMSWAWRGTASKLHSEKPPEEREGQRSSGLRVKMEGIRMFLIPSIFLSTLL